VTAPAAGLFEDAALVRKAQAGDREAFAQLYDRYFERVYDFVRRTLRDEADAADVTQEVFIKAMGSLGALSNPDVFKSWLFTIARNLSISRIRARREALSLDYPAAEDGDATLSDILPDHDSGASPEAAAERAEMAAMVWAVAAGLDARQYTVLDLSVRQELGAEEMAAVLGVTRNNAYVMVNRTKAAFSEACTDYMLYRAGRRECAALAGELAQAGVEGFSPAARKVLERHVKRCDLCGERKKRLPLPLAMFGGFALAAPPAGLRERLRGDLLRAPIGSAPVPVLEGDSGLPAFAGEGAAAAGGAGRGARRAILFAVAALGAMLLALLAGVVTFAVLDDDGSGPVAEPGDEVVPTATHTPTPAPTNAATPSRSATPLPATTAPSPGATATTTAPAGIANTVTPAATTTPPAAPTATLTATATATPSWTPTSSPTPTSTPTSTPTATSTPTPTSTPTATSTPTPAPLQVSTVQACWVNPNGTLRLTVTVANRGTDALSGTATYLSQSGSFVFNGSTGVAQVFSSLTPGQTAAIVVNGSPSGRVATRNYTVPNSTTLCQ